MLAGLVATGCGQRIMTTDFFHDRRGVWLSLLLIVLAVVNSLFVVLQVDHSQTSAELVYWTVGGAPQFDVQPTNRFYLLVAYALLVALTSTLVGYRLHKKSRVLAHLTFSLGSLVIVCNLIISHALLRLQ